MHSQYPILRPHQKSWTPLCGEGYGWETIQGGGKESSGKITCIEIWDVYHNILMVFEDTKLIMVVTRDGTVDFVIDHHVTCDGQGIEKAVK